MAAQYKTRCPHCQAQFRIGEEHLRQAKGQVRCGSCLKVFLATENLVSESAPEKPEQPKKKNAAAKNPAKPASPPEPSEKWQMPEEENGAGSGSRWTLGDEEAPAPTPTSKAPAKEADGDEANDTRLNLGGLELSDSFLSIDHDNDEGRLRDDDFSDLAGVASGGSSTTTDESWAEQLLEELEDEPDARSEPRSPAPRPAPADTSSKRNDSRSPEAPRGKQHPRAVRERDEWMQDIEPADPFGAEADSLLDSLPEDDLTLLDLDREQDRTVAHGGFGEMVRWSLASVALMVLLGVQYMIFEFEDLARRPALRPLYAALCERLPCQLPTLTDLGSLRASNLVVRPHPEAGEALMIDLLLHNDSAFQQPWPDLELGFTSLEGSPVASRRFAPTEYLRGEAASTEMMPAGTPVHVSLEIIDPGARAVNYTLRPLPPTTEPL